MFALHITLVIELIKLLKMRPRFQTNTHFLLFAAKHNFRFCSYLTKVSLGSAVNSENNSDPSEDSV